jgi:hypothetical protein
MQCSGVRQPDGGIATEGSKPWSNARHKAQHAGDPYVYGLSRLSGESSTTTRCGATIKVRDSVNQDENAPGVS